MRFGISHHEVKEAEHKQSRSVLLSRVYRISTKRPFFFFRQAQNYHGGTH